MGDEVTVKTVAAERPEGVDEAVWNQATAMAEAIAPQLHADIDQRVNAGMERMQRQTLEAMGLAGERIAAGLRPPAAPQGGATVVRPFARFGDQLRAIRMTKVNGSADQRLLDIGAASGLSEGIPSDGGFLLQDTFSQEILLPVMGGGASQVFGRIPANRRITLSGNSINIKLPGVDETSRATGSRWGGIQVYRVAEGDQATPSKVTFRRIALELSKSMGLAYFTNEQLEDTPVVEAITRQAFGDELGFNLDNDGIRAGGSGEPLGILNSEALVTIAAEGGQPADTIVYENVLKMWARMYARGRANAVWYYNQDCEPQLSTMSLVIGTGGVPVFMPATAMGPATLFGRPLIPLEQCSTLGDVGDIILADMTQYWAIDKGGPNEARSVDVAFLTDEVAYRVTYRNDFRPTWATTLTPFKGSNKLAPFITLAAR